MREHPNSLEKIGTGLVCAVETFRGCNIHLVNKKSGFNGLSTNKMGEVRKIEVKCMMNSFNWISINGLIAIDKLFFERDYWIYFVLLPANYVVMAKGLPFLRQQLKFSENAEFIEDIQNWMKATKRLSRRSGLKFLPKLQLKFIIPLDQLVHYLAQNPNDPAWHNSVAEVWQNNDGWTQIYCAPEEI